MLLSEILKSTKGFEKGKKEKTLFSTEWISLRRIGDYVFSHEDRCNGNIIAVLPYKRIGKDGWDYGVRQENVPSWGDREHLTALTGGVDKKETPIQSAVRELKEESGIVCDESDLESLGTCRGTKSTDTTYHLFAVDVNKLKKTEPTGDDPGKIVWMHSGEIREKADCPILFTLVSKLNFH